MKNWPRWIEPQRQHLPAELREWLMDTGSLTQRLIQHAEQDFSVELLSCHWARPCPDESLLLGQNAKQLAYQREVFLKDGEVATVYARTVVPLSSYHAMRHRFDALGNRSLGEMLFNTPSLRRGNIEVACIQAMHDLYEQANHYVPTLPAKLWGRRSCFELDGHRILVNEIFLPSPIWSESTS